MSNPSAAMLVIGDEILSGRTRDANAYHLARELAAVGIDLKEIRVIPDDQDAIVTAVNDLRARHTHVFTSGGIGPTHDDITADAIAAAFEVGIDVRDDARQIMERIFSARGVRPNEAQLRMARIPDGGVLIDNAVSGVPGFSVENVHVLAGVPEIFEHMLVALLSRLNQGSPRVSRELRLHRGEGAIAKTLERVAQEYPELTIGSYPFFENGVHGTDLVIRGIVAAAVDQAYQRLRAELLD